MPSLPLYSLAGLPAWAVPAVGVLAVAALTALAYLAGSRRRQAATTDPDLASENGRRWEGLEMVLTLAAAGIATAVAVNGMWRVFGDALGFTGPGRIALAGFLEIALMVSAIRARRSLRDTGTVGVDGAAVWAMAALSAILAAADAHGLARAFRFIAPLVAAWLWERGMAADRRATRPTQQRDPIAWRLTRHRLAVRLGLADPTHRAGTDIDRAHRLAQLTRARLRLAVLSTPMPRLLAWLTLRPVRRAIAAWRLQRHALAAVEHLQLGTDPTITTTITSTVAAVVGLPAATDPAALAASPIDPWTATPARTGSGALPPLPVAAIGPILPTLPTPPSPDRNGSVAANRSDSRPDPATDPTLTDPQVNSSDRIAAPVRVGTPPDDRRSVAARSDDIERLREAIAAGQLPPRPTVDTVRRHLRISPAYARAARAALTATAAHRVTAEQAQPSSNHDQEGQQPEGETPKTASEQEEAEEPIPVLINHYSRNLTQGRAGMGTDATPLP
jgi:hypothetical protein